MIKVSADLHEVIEAWKTGVTKQTNDLFSGATDTIPMFWDIIKDGKIAKGGMSQAEKDAIFKLDRLPMQHYGEKILYSLMIPRA